MGELYQADLSAFDEYRFSLELSCQENQMKNYDNGLCGNWQAMQLVSSNPDMSGSSTNCWCVISSARN